MGWCKRPGNQGWLPIVVGCVAEGNITIKRSKVLKTHTTIAFFWWLLIERLEETSRTIQRLLGIHRYSRWEGVLPPYIVPERSVRLRVKAFIEVDELVLGGPTILFWYTAHRLPLRMGKATECGW